MRIIVLSIDGDQFESYVVEVCPDPTNAVNANSPELSTDGASATYSCLPGFVIVGMNGQTSITIRCNIATQFWPVPSCTRELIPAR